MKGAVTARCALRHGLPKNAMTTDPYRQQGGRAVWVRIADIRPSGYTHVDLKAEGGRWFRVDWDHPIFSVKP